MTAIPPRAAFVVGVPRSGTTLLTRLLDGHPELVALPFETHASRWVGRPDAAEQVAERMRRALRIARGSPQAEELVRSLRARLPARADLRALLLAAVGGLLELRAAAPRALCWVEKTPRHLRVVPELVRAFGPETRVLALVRDPRAVFVSRRERFDRRAPGNLRHFAQRWALADAMTRRFRARFPGFLALRYEDLVCDVDGAMRRVADHLEIGWDEALLRPTHSGEDWLGNSTFEPAHVGVSRSSVERWRAELDPREVERLERLLGGRMRAWGYRPASPSGNGTRLPRLALEAVTSLRLARHRVG
jgi:hypothetical protein